MHFCCCCAVMMHRALFIAFLPFSASVSVNVFFFCNFLCAMHLNASYAAVGSSCSCSSSSGTVWLINLFWLRATQTTSIAIVNVNEIFVSFASVALARLWSLFAAPPFPLVSAPFVRRPCLITCARYCVCMCARVCILFYLHARHLSRTNDRERKDAYYGVEIMVSVGRGVSFCFYFCWSKHV